MTIHTHIHTYIHTYTLYTYINRHAKTSHKTNTKYTMSLDYSSICNIGSINRIDSIMMGVDEGNLHLLSIVMGCRKVHTYK